MGCMCSSMDESAITTAVHIEIEAPSETVWSLVTDIASLPSTVSFVKAVEFVDHDEGREEQKGGRRLPPATTAAASVLKVGTRWIETRRLDLDSDSTGKQMKTVVRLEQNGYPRCLGVNIQFLQRIGVEPKEDVINTCTFTVQPMTERSCALICSIAFQSRTIQLLCIKQCCGRKLLHAAERYLLEELRDYEKAALLRHDHHQADGGSTTP